MKIGLISDTHGVLRQEFIDVLTTCDYILHAGDFDTERCYNALKELDVPMYMVRGNCDHGSWCNYIPERLNVPIGELNFYLIHNRMDLPFQLTETDIVVFGHTHQYTTFERHGITYINPGTAGNNRGDGLSIAVLDVEGREFKLTRITM